ncbi:hypothetical protein B296_00038191, partial [Ensete ventricosum]
MQGKMHGKSLSRHVSESNRMIVETSGPPKRLYQVWKGSNLEQSLSPIQLDFTNEWRYPQMQPRYDPGCKTTYENFRYRYDGKMNPYNHGCFHNVKEVLFSGIPKSMNNFRAKVIEDSARFTSSHSTGQVMAPDLPKPSFDLEIGVKRHTVSAEELEDIQNQFEIRPLERSDSQPPHSIWTDDKGNWDDALVAGFGTRNNWERTHDIEASSAEFGTESGFGD